MYIYNIHIYIPETSRKQETGGSSKISFGCIAPAESARGRKAASQLRKCHSEAKTNCLDLHKT